MMFLNSILLDLLDTMVYYGCCYPEENQLKIGSLVGPAIFLPEDKQAEGLTGDGNNGRFPGAPEKQRDVFVTAQLVNIPSGYD